MKNPRHILLFFICFVLFFGVPVVYRQSARSQYIRAIQCAKEKQYDFAFLEFRGILRDFPKTKYAKEAQFAMGEYFYGLKMYYEAIKTEFFSKPLFLIHKNFLSGLISIKRK